MLENEDNRQNISSSAQFFDLSNVENFEYEETKQCFSTICAWINSNTNIETYMKFLRQHAISHEKWAMEGIHTDLLHKVYSLTKKWFVPEEKILFYKENSFIVKDEGILITTNHIYGFEKSQITRLSFADVYSIHISGWFGHGSWYFNSNYSIKIDNKACSIMEQGVIMALICTLIRQQNQSGYKIKVYDSIEK